MSLTIGRAGTECGLLVPEEISVDGRSLSIDGYATVDLSHEQLVDLFTIRDQLAGLGDNPDERWAPLAWSDQPEFDGIWEVISVDVDMDNTSVNTGKVEFGIELLAPQSRVAPSTEVITVAGLRVNDNGILSCKAYQGIPSEARQYYDGISTPTEIGISESGVQRWCDDGGTLGVGIVRLYQLPDPPLSTSSRFTIPPAFWYRGGCRVTYEDLEGNRRSLVGTQFPAGVDLSTIRIENGIMRAGVASGSEEFYGGTGRVITEMFVKEDDEAEGVWDMHRCILGQLVALPFYTDMGDPLEDWPIWMQTVQAVTAIRNGPEQVTVRVVFESAPSGIPAELTTVDRSTLDLTLRRGQMIVECRWLSDVASLKGVSYEVMSPPATLTDVLGGAIGHPIYGMSELSRWLILTPQEYEDPDSDVRLGLVDPSKGFSFGLGHALLDDVYGFDQGDITVETDHVLLGPTPENDDSGPRLKLQYFAAMAEQQQVVGQ